MSQILVYGWYGHQNIGDELMAKALQTMLPEFSLKFVDYLKKQDVENCSLVLIGGGSFLYAPLRGQEEAKKLLLSKPIIYVGIGAETSVNAEHQQLLTKAEAVFVRNIPCKQFQDIVKKYNKIQDLSLLFCTNEWKKKPTKSLLYIPNSELLPNVNSPLWVKAAWDYSKSEICQTFDQLIEDNWSITLAPFCNDKRVQDIWACHEIVSYCKNRQKLNVLSPSWFDDFSFEKIAQYYDKSSIVITQRFHGALLAQCTITPSITIHHHEKLAKLDKDVTTLIPYYGLTKQMLLESIVSAKTPVGAFGNACFEQFILSVKKLVTNS